MSKLQLSILIVLMLVSAGLNLRNYYLKSLLDEKAMEGALREGDDISSLRLFGKSSGGLGFSPGSAPSLLFIFSSDCRYSYQAVPFWKELQKSFSGRDRRILAIASGPSTANESFARALGLPLTVAHREQDEKSWRQAFRRTPQTVFVSPQGIVVRSWAGLPQGAKNKSSIMNYLERH